MSEYIAPVNDDEDLIIDPESVKIAISMVIRELEYVIDTDMFDTVEGDCLYEDEAVTPDMEENFVNLAECIDYHFDVTCVKLEEVVERLNRLYDRVENLLYIDKLFELTEDLYDDNFNDSKEYNVNMANIETAEIEAMDVEEQMITFGMTKELNDYLYYSSTYVSAMEDYSNAKVLYDNAQAVNEEIKKEAAIAINTAEEALNSANAVYAEASNTLTEKENSSIAQKKQEKKM